MLGWLTSSDIIINFERTIELAHSPGTGIATGTGIGIGIGIATGIIIGLGAGNIV